MLRDRNPSHWKLMVFYYNPEESRLFVAKRSGSPIALNYARPMAWVLTFIPIGIMAGAAVVESFHFFR